MVERKWVRRVLMGSLILIASVVVGKVGHPMLGLAVLTGLMGTCFALRMRENCPDCGPVFARKSELDVEVDEALGIVRLRHIYSCPKCRSPVRCNIETMSKKEYDDWEVRKIMSGAG